MGLAVNACAAPAATRALRAVRLAGACSCNKKASQNFRKLLPHRFTNCFKPDRGSGCRKIWGTCRYRRKGSTITSRYMNNRHLIKMHQRYTAADRECANFTSPMSAQRQLQILGRLYPELIQLRGITNKQIRKFLTSFKLALTATFLNALLNRTPPHCCTGTASNAELEEC